MMSEGRLGCDPCRLFYRGDRVTGFCKINRRIQFLRGDGQGIRINQDQREKMVVREKREEDKLLIPLNVLLILCDPGILSKGGQDTRMYQDKQEKRVVRERREEDKLLLLL